MPDLVQLSKLPVAITSTDPTLRLGVYGEGGVGKTSLALTFPKPLVIDTDSGLEGDAVVNVDGDEWSPDRWQDLNALYAFIKAKADTAQYKTIVIDSIDTLCRFLRHEAENISTTGRPANASETQMITATEQDYGRVETAVDIFLTKLKVLSRSKGIHIVITSAVREPNPEKGRLKRTFDVQPAVERNLLYWCNIYGEMEAVEVAKKVDGQVVRDAKGEAVLEEGRILWTKVSDRSRKNKTRFSALRPGVSDPTFAKIMGLIKGDAK
jgi:hypothetical protein